MGKTGKPGAHRHARQRQDQPGPAMRQGPGPPLRGRGRGGGGGGGHGRFPHLPAGRGGWLPPPGDPGGAKIGPGDRAGDRHRRRLRAAQGKPAGPGPERGHPTGGAAPGPIGPGGGPAPFRSREAVEALYQARQPRYRQAAAGVIQNHTTLEEAARQATAEFLRLARPSAYRKDSNI